jgi:hypothetical protein
MMRYTRGKLTVLNREVLQATACEYYGVIKDEYARSLGTGCGQIPDELFLSCFVCAEADRHPMLLVFII